MNRWGWLAYACVATSCWRSRPPPAPPPIVGEPARPPADAAPKRAETRTGLYDLDEALADALSGPWTFVGTGEWFGMFRVNACVYKNDRVFIVNKYCTLKEKAAAGVVVLSPTRGRVFIYAEGSAPISGTRRADWITFKAESNLQSDPPPNLDFTYAELRAWDEKRYYQHVPGCFGGIEIKRPVNGCYRLDEKDQPWGEHNKEFLREPPDEWYRIVHEMRERAKREARPYTGP